ncbi:Pycsar system effector family protein [Streptomyces tubercidicus]|uniref:Pycsar system effector family protein n=1 Tax=Streptomyces tubercidicus TaxID=47759 RepID=UPI0036D17F3B
MTDHTVDCTDQAWAEALTTVKSEITKADTKSGHILTLDGLLVAALSLMSKQSTGVALVLAAAGAAALAVSVLLALLVIRPRLGAPGGTHDRASFVYWATASPDEIATGMQEDRRNARLKVLSKIALRKMHIQRLAGYAAFVATVFTAVAALLSH